MAKVRREVHVNSSGAGRFERTIPRAAQNGYALHRGALIATNKETGGSRRQDGCHVVREGAERGLVDGADASQADLVSLGVGATRLQRRGIAQANQISERRRDAVAGHIRVGVRVKQCDTGADQGRDDAPLRVSHRQEGRATQEQRMVRDHHVVGFPVTGRTGDGLSGNSRGGIKREEN
jgi:hypothetical protein